MLVCHILPSRVRETNAHLNGRIAEALPGSVVDTEESLITAVLLHLDCGADSISFTLFGTCASGDIRINRLAFREKVDERDLTTLEVLDKRSNALRLLSCCLYSVDD